MLRKLWSLTCRPRPGRRPLFAVSIHQRFTIAANMRAGTKAERDATAVFGNFIKEKCDSGGRGDVLKMLLSACGVVYGADYHGGKVPHGVVHMDQLFELLAPEDLRPGQTELGAPAHKRNVGTRSGSYASCSHADYSKKKSGAHMLGGHVPDDKAVDRIFTKLDADGQPAKRWRVREFSCLLLVACWCRTLLRARLTCIAVASDRD
jgi:catechol 2,3-dioxygenase-like lactoylglutathione lyase family enzyme